MTKREIRLREAMALIAAPQSTGNHTHNCWWCIADKSAGGVVHEADCPAAIATAALKGAAVRVSPVAKRSNDD